VATTEEKMQCADRELLYRKRVYPRLVGKGRMTLEAARREIAIMEEIAADYRALAAEEPLPLFIETTRTLKGGSAP
jgi:hypothetical protein